MFGGIIHMDIAGARRDRVALVKKIFLVVKIVLMIVLATVATIYLVYASYAAKMLEKDKEAEPTWEGFMEYLQDTDNSDPVDRMMISISYGICSFLSSAFVVFLVIHGIQVLVIKFIMRNADHG
jgi:hypothetical protein